MNNRKRKRRSDSKCQHSEESLTRQWGDRLYCLECQRSNVKASRARKRDLDKRQRESLDRIEALQDDRENQNIYSYTMDGEIFSG